MLAEDTDEHREIFGEEGRAVLYFRTIPEMTDKCSRLLRDDRERLRLSTEAHSLIIRGCNTYGDRLVRMLQPAITEVSTP
jgi:hypothetical protein